MKLLLVEDEDRVARVLARGLAEEGHQVDVCGTGLAAREQATTIAYDVVLLDWSLPDLDGISVLREWRARGLRTPVLLLTARGSTGEKVTGLRAGADDYLVKPFDFDELIARIEALHRRGGASDVSALGPVTLDARRRALIAGAKSETLTAREYGLIAELARHAGEVLSRSRLIETVWGQEFEGNSNVVDVYVGYLRTKLDRLGAAGVRIESVRGVGYRLSVPPGAGA
ncbi:response regulator transcription factor [Anaeromyxobacter sp. PSR-1]|uniref:response regulator transcription factor n=1 Tax=Anaeromyxobacter sp. PSR-1 TaxID=1300915 RepID=UPI0005E6E028|nr:response regulator transcription factor [Anaeromyxobacter sp. PSR-1]GAO02082.1 transcriptional regulatory protein CusR [Anaeromyxobacter sp. PSR-1]